MGTQELDVVDALVIGAGVVGLAAAAAIAELGHSVAVVERHPRPGMETSTHNSGVIHAGIYYPAGTLKASLCVEGADRLYAFCERYDVPHERCGKLIVADDEAALEALRRAGTVNGVKGLEVVDAAFVRRREPYVREAPALWSPNTGRVDASLLILALRRHAEAAGAMIAPGAPFVAAEPMGEGFRVRTSQESIDTGLVVNAAGLHADEISAAWRRRMRRRTRRLTYPWASRGFRAPGPLPAPRWPGTR